MIESLKCDVPGCGHVEPVGKITADMVGMPCPKCSADMLTLEDWQKWQPLTALLTAINGIEDHKEGKKDTLITIGLHAGKTTIEIEPQKEQPHE